jgi:hypothetical protein
MGAAEAAPQRNADGDRAGYHAENEEWNTEIALPHGVDADAIESCELQESSRW